MPTLVPGAGNWAAFEAVVAGLGQIGSGQYDEAIAIARWSTIPRLTVAASIQVGIVAFHADEIDHVDFYLEGGNAASVSAMTLNPDTELWDYNVTFDPASVTDGLIQIAAIVYPNSGYARVLYGTFDATGDPREKGEHSLYLNANADSTLPVTHVYCNSVTGNDSTGDGSSGNPYASTTKAMMLLQSGGDRDGGIVHVTGNVAEWPGEMNTWDDNDQYCTISLEGDATITSFYSVPNYRGLGCTWQRVVGANKVVNLIVGISVDQPFNSQVGYQAPFIYVENVGLDGVTMEGGGAGVNTTDFSRGWAITDFDAFDLDTAIALATWVLRGTISNIGEDVLVNNQGLVADLVIHDTRQLPPQHGDLIQHNNGFGGDEFHNVIYYCCRSQRVGDADEGVQGLFIRTNGDQVHQDLAVVNCDFSYAGNSQILQDLNHFVVWHSQFTQNADAQTGGNMLLIDDTAPETTTITNINVRNSFFDLLTVTATGGPNPADTTWADNNHVFSGTSIGTNLTTGSTLAALFTDPDTEDYTPKAAGALVERTAGLLVPGDALGNERLSSNGAIGAYEFGSAPATGQWFYFRTAALQFFIGAEA